MEAKNFFRKKVTIRGVSDLPKVAPDLQDKASGHSKDIVKILSQEDSKGMLLFDIYLGDKCITALFDTGAEVSLVHSEVLKELCMAYKQVKKSVLWGGLS